MEGGVRHSRASSRYASGQSPAVFNGPCQKVEEAVGRHLCLSLHFHQSQQLPLPSSPSLSLDPTLFRHSRPDPHAPLPIRSVVPIEKGKRKTQEKVSNEGRTSTINQSNNGGHMIRSDSDSMLEKPSSGDTPREEAE
ncbi:hypothetical protein OROMI_034851 [Orobanche minor]